MHGSAVGSCVITFLLFLAQFLLDHALVFNNQTKLAAVVFGALWITYRMFTCFEQCVFIPQKGPLLLFCLYKHG